jgi:putative acetyltransferase
MIYLETIEQRDEALFSALLLLWESSVKASHHFLDHTAIQELRPAVRESLREVAVLAVCRDESGQILAFMGVDGPRLEMLFAAPFAWGQGAGSRLLAWAIADMGVDETEVNRQNPRAIKFYEKFGFRIGGASELDGQGRPYPILRMRLEAACHSFPHSRA